jgi:tRNA dimethylallyltransferase
VLRRNREELHRRIALRVRAMFDDGLLEETECLRARYPMWSETASGAIGYSEALAVLDGRMSKDEAVNKISVRTNRLAKRQETWFRHQTVARWIDVDEQTGLEELAERILKFF